MAFTKYSKDEEPEEPVYELDQHTRNAQTAEQVYFAALQGGSETLEKLENKDQGLPLHKQVEQQERWVDALARGRQERESDVNEVRDDGVVEEPAGDPLSSPARKTRARKATPKASE